MSDGGEPEEGPFAEADALVRGAFSDLVREMSLREPPVQDSNFLIFDSIAASRPLDQLDRPVQTSPVFANRIADTLRTLRLTSEWSLGSEDLMEWWELEMDFLPCV